jgi:hypothetical protein
MAKEGNKYERKKDSENLMNSCKLHLISCRIMNTWIVWAMFSLKFGIRLLTIVLQVLHPYCEELLQKKNI